MAKGCLAQHFFFADALVALFLSPLYFSQCLDMEVNAAKSRQGALGILLSAAPGSSEFHSAMALAKESQRKGLRVFLYLLDDAVEGAKEMRGLAEQGVRISACAYAAQRRSLPFCQHVVYGGLSMLNNIIAHSNYFASDCAGKHLSPPNNNMLIVVSADPRANHRAAEAVRVAAGLAALGELRVGVCFCGAGALILSRPASAFADGEVIETSLSVLAKYAAKIWAQTDDSFLEGEKQTNYERIVANELDAIAAYAGYVIHF